LGKLATDMKREKFLEQYVPNRHDFRL
jgi:hypothetical protein